MKNNINLKDNNFKLINLKMIKKRNIKKIHSIIEKIIIIIIIIILEEEIIMRKAIIRTINIIINKNKKIMIMKINKEIKI